MKNSRVFVVITGLALSACTSKLSIDGVKKAISEGINTQLALPIASVTCPESREIKANDTFECTATPAMGGKLTVKVTQKDDKGNIAWEVAKSEGLLDLVALETVIKNGLKEQSETEATVSCGGKFRAAEAGKTFECTATDPEGAKHQVAVTIKDAAGNVSYEVVQPQQ